MLDPFQFLLVAVAGWMNQRQQQAIEYLREENRVLREQLGERRVRFNDDQRRRLAVRAKGLGRKLLALSGGIKSSPCSHRYGHDQSISDRSETSTAVSGLASPRNVRKFSHQRFQQLGDLLLATLRGRYEPSNQSCMASFEFSDITASVNVQWPVVEIVVESVKVLDRKKKEGHETEGAA
jgi:hypothetical protein